MHEGAPTILQVQRIQGTTFSGKEEAEQHGIELCKSSGLTSTVHDEEPLESTGVTAFTGRGGLLQLQIIVKILLLKCQPEILLLATLIIS